MESKAGNAQEANRLYWQTDKSVGDIAEELYKRVKSSSFKKTDFALALLAQDPNGWTVPLYVADGLRWLAEQLVLADREQPAAGGEQAGGTQV